MGNFRWQLAILATSASLVLIAAPARAQDKAGSYVDVERSMTKQEDAAKAAAALVSEGPARAEDMLRHLAETSAYVRDRLVKTLIDDATDETLAALAKGLKTSNDLLIESLGEVYEAKASAAVRELLIKALERRKLGDDARIACLRALAAAGPDDQAVKAVAKLYKRERRSFRLKGEALRSLAILEPDKARARIDEAAADKLRGLRMMAIDLLVRREPKAGAVLAARWIAGRGKDRDKVWAPRQLFAALHALRSIEKRSALKAELGAAIEAMIGALDGALGREKTELGETLTDISGAEDLAPEAFAWKSWWEARRDSWEPKDKPKKGKEKAGEEKGVATQVRFHGVPIDSLQVAFIQDISGGMKNPTKGRGSKSPSKLSVSKQELNQVFAKLDDAASVNVIYFASYFFACGPKPFPIKKARKKLIAFNAKQAIPTKRGHGRSNLYDSVRYALEQPNIDTIFILTEGGPSAGKIIDKGRFMKDIERLNVFYRVRIQTLLLGTSSEGASFLRALAETTEGRYHDLKKLRGS